MGKIAATGLFCDIPQQYVSPNEFQKSLEKRFLKAFLVVPLLTAALLIAAPRGNCTVCEASPGSVRILSNDFASLRIVGAAAQQCADSTVAVTRNQTTQFADIELPALRAKPAKYTVVVVSNNSMTSLLNDHLIRPLDELVVRFGRQLRSNQLVKIDGKIMAIAFMIDAQHLFYREDVLAQAGVSVPKTYEEVLEAARIIRERGIMQYPLAATDRPDWELAEEFINMYFGYGGDLFKPNSAEAAIDNEQGVEALEMMKALSAYMSPDYLTYSIEVLPPMWEASQVAMANLWGSSAESFLTGKHAVSKIAAVTKFAAAPTVGGHDIPSTTLWWDGFSIASNISDEDAATSFQVMMHAISAEVASAHSEAAVWLAEGYKPGPEGAAVMASVQGHARSYPMVPYMGYLHRAIGSNLAKFMQGRQSAQQALQSAVAAYTTAAREAGYLR